ncbi:MAG TPA: SMR family transporter [Bellilinea sp.]|nr:SMR family transporter [Bellilinea sp.]
MRSIPISTSYAIWTGIGAVLTVIYSMATGMEPVSVLKIIFLSGLILCIIGLKLMQVKAV